MLSDKAPERKSPKSPKKLGDRAHRWYSDNEKLEAVKLWLVMGNLPMTAAALNIPLPTLKVWRYAKWWGELVAEIKAENSIVLSNKLKKIADKSLEVISDRLENGDYFYDQKIGELVRRPVAIRDALNAANSLLEKQIMLEKKPDEVQTQQVQDRLASLADAFAQMAKKTRKIDVIDVEVLHGVQTETQTEAQEVNAIQIEGPAEVDVFSEAGNGEEMGSEDSEYKETT